MEDTHSGHCTSDHDLRTADFPGCIFPPCIRVSHSVAALSMQGEEDQSLKKCEEKTNQVGFRLAMFGFQKKCA